VICLRTPEWAIASFVLDLRGRSMLRFKIVLNIGNNLQGLTGAAVDLRAHGQWV
jgi:hypothetical protein